MARPNRIKGMFVEGCEETELPRRIERLGISTMDWGLKAFNRWLKMNPNQT